MGVWLYEFEAALLKKLWHTEQLPASPLIIKFLKKSIDAIKIMYFLISLSCVSIAPDQHNVDLFGLKDTQRLVLSVRSMC